MTKSKRVKMAFSEGGHMRKDKISAKYLPDFYGDIDAMAYREDLDLVQIDGKKFGWRVNIEEKRRFNSSI